MPPVAESDDEEDDDEPEFDPYNDPELMRLRKFLEEVNPGLLELVAQRV